MNDAVCPIVLDREGSDIHAEGARIRERGPVTRVELPGGVQAWSITSYELIKQVLVDPKFQKDPRKHWAAYLDGKIPEDWPMIGWVIMDNMTTHDGEDHARLRRLLMKAFTAGRVEGMREHIEHTVNDLLDVMERVGLDQVIDLKNRYTKALPARLMCDLFGVPARSRDDVLRGGQVNIDTRITPEEARANVEQWHDAIAQLIEDKRREPGDDLASDLIAARDADGGSLSTSELMGTLHLLLGAGSETLMNGLSHAILAVLTDSRLRALLSAGEVTWDDVFEETLRVQSPVAQLPFRFATEDIGIGGVTIAKGEAVLIGFAAAGRDPALHGESADCFDATRGDKTHISFGYGVHYCLGVRLARLAASIALPALFDRFPDLTLAVRPEELEPQGTFIMNGHAQLPVSTRKRVGDRV